MKHLRSMLASIMAIVMVFAMSVTAFADEGSTGHTISLDDKDTHKYRVYQVLTGTLSEEGSNELGNAAWGADVIANPGNVADFVKSITETTDEQTIANLVYAKVDTSSEGQGTVSKGSPLSGLATGYYIMVDITNLSDADHNNLDTQARHVVKVVNDINGMAIKWGTTQVDKIIVDDTLGDNDNTEVNGKADDKTDNVSVGDTVNYQITATIPANAKDYNYFYFIVNDTLDKGLTLDPTSIVVTIDGTALEAGADKDYILKTGNDAKDYSFQVGLTDAKSYSGKDVVVTYSAVLNEFAEIGGNPNKNTSTVTFSNNPNHVYNGVPGNPNPGFPASGDDTAMGETPETETKTYSTGIEIQKVDENGNVLTGATFELSGDSIESVLTVEETFTADDNGDYYKLKDGTYTKDAPTQDGQYMVKADAGATAGYVIDASYTGEDAKTVGGVKYRPYVPATDEGQDIFILRNGNAHLYDNPDQKYSKTTKKTLNETVEDKKIAKAVDSNGLVRFDGLGAGTYTITETVTPSGYNTLDPLTVTVSFDKDKTPVWSFNGGNGAYDANEGIYKITIKNNKGTALPSTGGIGTTIFYVVGGVMVAGAVVFLLTKRRMAGNE